MSILVVDYCRHPETEVVELAITGEAVGRVCATCLDALPLEWGCRGCSWYNLGTLGNPRVRVALGERCDQHEAPQAIAV